MELGDLGHFIRPCITLMAILGSLGRRTPCEDRSLHLALGALTPGRILDTARRLLASHPSLAWVGTVGTLRAAGKGSRETRKGH